MAQAFQSIKQGLNEAIAHARGAKAGVKLYQPQAVDVSQLRERLGLTQEQFAARFGFATTIPTNNTIASTGNSQRG